MARHGRFLLRLLSRMTTAERVEYERRLLAASASLGDGERIRARRAELEETAPERDAGDLRRARIAEALLAERSRYRKGSDCNPPVT